MKAKVLKRYRDKVTKERRAAGTEIEVTEERFAEINSTPYGVLLEAITEPAAVPPEDPAAAKPKPAKAAAKKKAETPEKE
jgi:hypothetical protein